MRTTLTLDDEAMAGIKQVQKKRPEATFKEIVNQLVKKGLAAEGETVKVRFKITPGHDTKPKAGLNYDKISELISIAEGDFHK
ncbi:MAG: hypothetical protein HOP17_13400 [Acidobacteria bacterium]|nr:hypothetical protein [Acidobacteriota bacterium]